MKANQKLYLWHLCGCAASGSQHHHSQGWRDAERRVEDICGLVVITQRFEQIQREAGVGLGQRGWWCHCACRNQKGRAWITVLQVFKSIQTSTSSDLDSGHRSSTWSRPRPSSSLYGCLWDIMDVDRHPDQLTSSLVLWPPQSCCLHLFT